jgi:ketosteroid isomerase-like protein
MAAALALMLFGTAAMAGNAEDAVAATQDLFVKMSARDLSGVSRYIAPEGFSETIPETDTLLQLDAKAFDGLFKSGRKIDVRAVEVQAQVFGDNAIVTGKRLGSVTAADVIPVEGRLAFSMVWSKRAEGWQLRHIHLSTLAAGK